MAWRDLFRTSGRKALVEAVRRHSRWQDAFTAKHGKPIARASMSEVVTFVDNIISDYERLESENAKLRAEGTKSLPTFKTLASLLEQPDLLRALGNRQLSDSYRSSGTTDRAMSSR